MKIYPVKIFEYCLAVPSLLCQPSLPSPNADQLLNVWDQGRLGQVAPGHRGLMWPPDAQTPQRQDLQYDGATRGALRGRMLAGGHQSREGGAYDLPD